VGALLVTATFVSIFRRLRVGDLPLFAPARSARALGAVVSASLILATVMPAVRQSAAWDRNPFAPAHPPHEFTGDLLRDYPLLNATNKLDASGYPIEVIRYLREDVPSNRTILTGDALSLLERVPHFAAVLSNRGGVAASYITNWEYLRRYSRSGSSFQLLPFMADDRGVQLFGSLLDEYRVDIVIVDPVEAAGVHQAWTDHEAIQAALRPVLERDGYSVYLVNRGKVPGAAR
jgi:hypothetical protein